MVYAIDPVKFYDGPPPEPTRQMRRWEERRLAKKMLRGKK